MVEEAAAAFLSNDAETDAASLPPLTLMCQLEGRSRPGDASERG